MLYILSVTSLMLSPMYIEYNVTRLISTEGKYSVYWKITTPVKEKNIKKGKTEIKVVIHYLIENFKISVNKI